MSFRLSFCIPTYNRATYLNETLDSIINQSDNSIEIIISDNASTDNTEEVVRKAKLKFPNITYYRWPQNMGADLNYLKTVELATGDFCWFLGSDDLIKNGAIEKIKKEIQEDNDIYLCSEYLCTRKLKPFEIHYLLPPGVQSRVFNLASRDQLLEYFQLAQSHSALFGYLSSIIFKREKWKSVVYDNTYTGTLYSHMFMLYSFIENGCRLKYIKEPLVYWRSGNDSFGGPGKIQSRYMIDINGFKKIMETFFHNDAEILSAFRGAFRRHHPFMNIAHLRLHTNSEIDWNDIEKKLVEDFEYNSSALAVIRNAYVKPVLFILILCQRIYGKFRRTLARILTTFE
jgi:abequosyltransferase